MKETTIEPYLPMLGRFEELFREELAPPMPVESIGSAMKAAVGHFQRIAPVIPEVPPTSPWVKNIIGVAWEIGLWKELAARGWSPAECSAATQRVLRKLASSSIPSGKIPQMREMLCSPDYVRRIASASHVSSAEDWLFDCVLPNADDAFDVGMDIVRCPVAELCSRIGAERFFPYFCVNDYVAYDVLGIRLTRTRTLAHGASCCDFRLTEKGAAEAEGEVVVRPELLPEFAGDE